MIFLGDGCFTIGISKSTNSKTGYAAGLRISVYQNLRDQLFIKSLVHFLGCGFTLDTSYRNIRVFTVGKFKDTNEKIIPMFKKSKILGIKVLDFEDFCRAGKIMEEKKNILH